MKTHETNSMSTLRGGENSQLKSSAEMQHPTQLKNFEDKLFLNSKFY